MKRQFDRLEQALRLWEDSCYLLDFCNRINRLTGQPATYQDIPQADHWGEFRDYLLHLNRNLPFDHRRFLGESEERGVSVLEAWYFLPFLLGTWTSCSRRVYHLDSDLQTLLSLTSVDDVKWQDLSWPFESFVLSLDSPLVGMPRDDGVPVYFDTIMVTKSYYRPPTEPGVQIETAQVIMLDNRLEQRQALSRFDRDRAEELLRKGRINDALKHLTDKKRYRSVYSESFRLDFSRMSDLRLGETSSQLQEIGAVRGGKASLGAWDAAARIIGGLCLYLQSLPSKSPHVSSWQPLEPGIKNPDPRAISTGAEVCHVSSVYRLTAEEREVVEQIGKRGHYELCAHFRTGHWRRRPGTGNDPAAPKVVHVRPTLVRRDRLAEGQLPGGSEEIVG